MAQAPGPAGPGKAPPKADRAVRGRTIIYPVSPVRRWLIGMIIGPFPALLIIFAFAGHSSERAAILLTAGLLFLIALPFHLLVGWTRLELGESGIRLRQAGYSLVSSWENITRLRLAHGREGFVTSEPMAGKGAARLARFRFAGRAYAPLYDVEQRRLLEQRRLIPIEAFAWHIRHGDMGQVIARFAPDLDRD